MAEDIGTQAAATPFLVLPNLEAINREAVARFAHLARQRGPFRVALSGGSTPQSLYEMISCPPFHRRIPWAQVHAFWGDERCVPPDRPDSNYRMARQVLLDRVSIPPVNVHRIHGEWPPERAADAYQEELVAHLGPGGQFDLILLGMGADGHTASLFPGTTALTERERAVVAVYVAKLRTWRVTLTLPALNAARHVLFLVSGATKAPALKDVRAGVPLPAGLVRPTDGQLTWLVDRAAWRP
jgi:6-phosphogluconolactonase